MSTSTAPQIEPIDVDSIEDDLVVLSPRSFAEAKKNSRRNRGGVVVDLDSGDSSRHLNNRRTRNRVPTNQQVINCNSYVDLGSETRNSKQAAAPPRNQQVINCDSYVDLGSETRNSKQVAVPPPPPPEEPAFSCPVCMGPLVEEMTTKCGHIFCKTCIQASIAAQSKCPTCRRKVTMKDTLRVYLPTTR